MTPQDALGLPYIFLSLVLQSTTSLRSLGFFYWGMMFGTQDLGAGCVHWLFHLLYDSRIN